MLAARLVVLPYGTYPVPDLNSPSARQKSRDGIGADHPPADQDLNQRSWSAGRKWPWRHAAVAVAAAPRVDGGEEGRGGA